MNRFFTLLFAASSLTVVGQVTYPYNPDGNADGDIAVGDLQDFLGTYGNPFIPSEILVDGETLTTVLTQLQNSIDSLSGLTGSGGSVLDMPLGTVLPIATESVPEGWMLCDGREIPIEEYQGLYDLIGTTYGAGDSAFWAQVFYPATTFNIPDLRGRTIIGANDMGGEAAGILLDHNGQLGQSGGEELHQLTIDEMPSHSHNNAYGVIPNMITQPFKYNSASGSQRAGANVLTEEEGGDQPHNNMQPYMALNYMIKVQVAEDVIAGLENRIAEIEESISGDPTNFFSKSFNADSLNVAYTHELEVVGEYLDDPIVAVPAGVDVVLCSSGKAYLDLSLSGVTRLTFESYSSGIWQSANIVECPSNQKRLATVVKIQGEWLELK